MTYTDLGSAVLCNRGLDFHWTLLDKLAGRSKVSCGGHAVVQDAHHGDSVGGDTVVDNMSLYVSPAIA